MGFLFRVSLAGLFFFQALAPAAPTESCASLVRDFRSLPRGRFEPIRWFAFNQQKLTKIHQHATTLIQTFSLHARQEMAKDENLPRADWIERVFAMQKHLEELAPSMGRWGMNGFVSAAEGRSNVEASLHRFQDIVRAKLRSADEKRHWIYHAGGLLGGMAICGTAAAAGAAIACAPPLPGINHFAQVAGGFGLTLTSVLFSGPVIAYTKRLGDRMATTKPVTATGGEAEFLQFLAQALEKIRHPAADGVAWFGFDQGKASFDLMVSFNADAAPILVATYRDP